MQTLPAPAAADTWSASRLAADASTHVDQLAEIMGHIEITLAEMSRAVSVWGGEIRRQVPAGVEATRLADQMRIAAAELSHLVLAHRKRRELADDCLWRLTGKLITVSRCPRCRGRDEKPA